MYSTWVMLMVVFFSGLKAIVLLKMAYKVFTCEDYALRTMGDAIASFLDNEDTTTMGMCLVTSEELERDGWRDYYEARVYESKEKPRWSSATRNFEYWSTHGLSVILFIISFCHYAN
jgi:hypothetical protein